MRYFPVGDLACARKRSDSGLPQAMRRWTGDPGTLERERPSRRIVCEEFGVRAGSGRVISIRSSHKHYLRGIPSSPLDRARWIDGVVFSRPALGSAWGVARKGLCNDRRSCLTIVRSTRPALLRNDLPGFSIASPRQALPHRVRPCVRTRGFGDFLVTHALREGAQRSRSNRGCALGLARAVIVEEAAADSRTCKSSGAPTAAAAYRPTPAARGV